MKRELWNALALVAGVLLLAGGGPWLARELASLPRHGALAARAHQRVVVLDVGGMHCPGCAAAIRKELEAVPGVSAAEVRLAQSKAYVVCERSLADTALTAAVRRAGPGFLGAISTP